MIKRILYAALTAAIFFTGCSSSEESSAGTPDIKNFNSDEAAELTDIRNIDRSPAVYFLQGHGEGTVSGSYKEFADRLRAENYSVDELDLDESGCIPDGASILYIAAPKSDITEDECRLILDFLDKGGSASFLLPPSETGRMHNIEYILGAYGLGINYDIVTETANENMLRNGADELVPEFMKVRYAASNPLTSDVIFLCDTQEYSAGISNTRNVYELSGVPDDLEIHPLVGSVSGSGGKFTVQAEAMGGDAETAEAAAKLSGTELFYGYNSYNKETGGKIFLMGTSDMIDGSMISRAVTGTSMLTLFSNTWLYDIESFS